MRIVLDTNVLISGIFWKGAPYRLLQECARERFELIASQRMLDEYFEVIQRIDTQHTITEEWTSFIHEHASIVADSNRIRLSRDSDDNVFINAAAQGRADALITGDKDLLSIRELSPVNIMTPAEFIQLLGLK